jgi:hypothetical protein
LRCYYLCRHPIRHFIIATLVFDSIWSVQGVFFAILLVSFVRGHYRSASATAEREGLRP